MIVPIYGSENKDHIKLLLHSGDEVAEHRGKRQCNRVPINFVANTTAYWSNSAIACFSRDITKPKHAETVLQRNKE